MPVLFVLRWGRDTNAFSDSMGEYRKDVVAVADWAAIKTEYITTDTSYRKLAKKYDMSQTQISSIGKAEGWVELRKQYLSKTVTKAISKASEKEASKLASLMTTTERAIGVVAKAFEDPDQFNRHLVTVRDEFREDTEERLYNKIDTKAIRDLTSVLKDLTGLMRDFYNIPTPAQAEAQRIAAERFELDKRKAAAEDSGSEGVVVILEGAGPEEWNE